MADESIQDEYDKAIPYLFVRNGASAIEFYKRAFGATELVRWGGPEGKVGHAEIKIGNSPIWLADESPETGFKSPLSLGGAGVSIFLYVADVDSAFSRAITAGASELRPVMDQFYGDRVGTLKDPFGHVWTLATRKEQLSPEELRARAEQFLRQSEG
ncbi:MAG TPA: VOC family protein [Pyrinomonadaceae bacterium]|jgi:PhnB protein|nr:VOC family protein [Pyrinomonadaceae bacterium]